MKKKINKYGYLYKEILTYLEKGCYFNYSTLIFVKYKKNYLVKWIESRKRGKNMVKIDKILINIHIK